jgi:hypothetical protein
VHWNILKVDKSIMSASSNLFSGVCPVCQNKSINHTPLENFQNIPSFLMLGEKKFLSALFSSYRSTASITHSFQHLSFKREIKKNLSLTSHSKVKNNSLGLLFGLKIIIQQRIPPWVNFFLWLLLHNKLNTRRT